MTKGIHSKLTISAVLSIFNVVFSTVSYAFPVLVSEAPTSDLNLTVSAISSAKKTLAINIYEFTSPQIADAVTQKVSQGVQVEILEEGQPVGGVSAAAKGIQSQILQAMKAARTSGNHFYLMAGKPRRFHYDHAKYIVVDGKNLLIGSENFSPTGNPAPGSVGNRGWEVFIQEPQIANQFETMFRSDADTSHGDVRDLLSGAAGGAAFALPQAELSTNVSVDIQNAGAQTFEASHVAAITSPDTSLKGLTDLIDGARTTIEIQQMDFDSNWKQGDSPLITAVENAAKRGVRVRVLLNDERVFPSPAHKNLDTVKRLNDLAAQSHLPLEARTANVKAMHVDYIHNKGLLVDSDKTVVSSINWNENSVTHNREAAVALTSTGVHDHYLSLFNSDWDASGAATQNHISGPNAAINTVLPVITTRPTACPMELKVSAEIGQLTLDDQEDQSFASLTGKSISGTFRRTEIGTDCVYVDETSSSRVAEKVFVELRTYADGALGISLEGYTTNGKLFAIKTRIADGKLSDQTLTATVTDASAPGREKLGKARLQVRSAD